MNKVESAARALVAEIDFRARSLKEFWKSFEAVPLWRQSILELCDAVHAEQFACRACGKPIEPHNVAGRVADGCPCNSARGVNHGLVPTWSCTCKECDPAETGSARQP